MSTQSVRLADVAQRAGTSTKTASRVLNGDPRVADDTRRRVQDAMNELGYQVDVLARSLRTGVDETIAVVVPTIGDPFFASMIEEIERAAFEGGIKVLVATNSRDPREEQRVINSLLARRVAGIIVTPYLADYSFLTAVQTPVVFLDRRPEGLDSGAILVDDHGWAKRATEHLCRHGHQRIAIVADDMRIKTSAYRLQGYRSALREWSLDVDSRLEALDCEQADDAYRATLELLDLEQPPTGIFSARSETTVGVIKALHHQNRTDTALVSFGDVELADLLSPPVTVVDHSARTLARRALERLQRRMHGDTDTPEDEIIDMSLIERGSGEIRPRLATAPAGRWCPMTRQRVVVGVDVGTTSMKAAAFALDGRSVGEASVVTCWDVGSGGETDMDVERLTRDFIDLVAELVETTGTQCIGIGITGMAETGVVVDEQGAARHRAFAWFDQRGAAELDDMPPNIRDAFAGTTGLALKAECSLSKLLWLQAQGFTINAGDVWLNAQEFLGFRLTGTRATEPSLASRTALWDQDGRPWTQALDLIGVSENFLPPFVAAGTSLGVVGDGYPESMQGAVVTVTGHDHLVAAIGSGAVGSNQLFNSCGTADVLVRSVPWVIDADSRAQLVAGGLSVGRHALSGHTAVLGATRFGLVMERVMAMLGVHDHAQRARLVDAWQNEGSRNDGSGNDVVSVSEPGGWVNEVRVSLHDTCSPDQVVAAAIDYGIHSMRGCLETMTSVTGPSDQVIAGGGWAQLDGVLRAKGSLLADLSRSTVSQPGVRGAAAFAGIAAGMTDEELTRELASHVQPPGQHPQQEKQKETVS